MDSVSDLEMFLLLHREHGRLTPVWGRATFNGRRLEVACSCGVMFGRWVTREDLRQEQGLRGLTSVGRASRYV